MFASLNSQNKKNNVRIARKPINSQLAILRSKDRIVRNKFAIARITFLF